MKLEDFEVDVHGKFGITPIKAEEGSVGYDIALPPEEGPLIMPYDSRRDIDTGIIVRPPEKCFQLIVPRSNSYKRSLRISNTVGVIDPSYSGQDDTLIVSLTREAHKKVYLGQITTSGSSPTEHSKQLIEYCGNELERNVTKMVGFVTDALSFSFNKNCLAILDEKAAKNGSHTWHLYGRKEPTVRVYERGARFCQALFMPYCRPDLVERKLDSFSKSNRGGFGSTGGV